MTKTKWDCMRGHGSNVPGMGKKPLPPLVSPPPSPGLSSPSSPKFEILEFPRASPRILLPVQSQHLRHNLIPPLVMPTFFTSIFWLFFVTCIGISLEFWRVVYPSRACLLSLADAEVTKPDTNLCPLASRCFSGQETDKYVIISAIISWEKTWLMLFR